MNTKSYEKRAQEPRVDRWVLAIRNHPVVAVLCVTAVISYGVASWVSNMSDVTKKVAEVIGVSESDEAKKTRRLKLAAFHFGHAVSNYSAMLFLSRKDPADNKYEGALKAARAEISVRLSNLHLSVKFDDVDFTWSQGTFGSSQALYLFGETLAEYGEEIQEAYLLGADLTTARWRARRFQDSIIWHDKRGVRAPPDRNDSDAILADLNERASDTIGPVDLTRFKPSKELKGLIHSNNSEADSMLLRVISLDIVVDTQLTH